MRVSHLTEQNHGQGKSHPIRASLKRTIFQIGCETKQCLWFTLSTKQGVNFFTSFYLSTLPLGESKGPQSASDSNLAAQFLGLFAAENNVPLRWLLASVSSLPAERWMTWRDLQREIKSLFCRRKLRQSLDFSFPSFWATCFRVALEK